MGLWDLGLGFWGLIRLRVQGSKGVEGLGFGMYGLGFGGLGFQANLGLRVIVTPE